MGVDKITLPPPVQTTQNRINLQSGFSGGNIAIYGQKSHVLSEAESAAFLANLDKQYRELQASEGRPVIGLSPFGNNNMHFPTRPQVIHGEDGNFYISAQDAPCLPADIDPCTGEMQSARQATATVIVAVNKEGEIKSVKAYTKTDPAALRQGRTVKEENTKGYLTGYLTTHPNMQTINHIQAEQLPQDLTELQRDPDLLNRIIDENLIDTRQLPKDGTPLVIGENTQP
jgi:hypothetical protein